MTILVSNPSNDFMIMLSDSAITNDNLQEDGTNYPTYEIKSKTYRFNGVGCITTWGDQTFNQLCSYLQRYRIFESKPSILDLAHYVQQYLEGFRKEHPEDELGFHIGGFGNDGKPNLYHAFWGFNRPRQPNELTKQVYLLDSVGSLFLYNGRNDLAGTLINLLISELRSGRETRYDLKTPTGRILWCDFIARFAAEITPQVGPPFEFNLIFPDNTIEKIVNPSLAPINLYGALPILPKIIDQPKGTSLQSQGTENSPIRPNLDTISQSRYSGGTVVYPSTRKT